MSLEMVKQQYGTGEKVLCNQNGRLYEARILDIKIVNDEMQYLVHYQGWNNRFDEWVTDERLYEYNEENLKKQQQLEAKKTRAPGGKMVGGGKLGRPGTSDVGGEVAALAQTLMSISRGNPDIASEHISTAFDGGSSDTTDIGGTDGNSALQPNRTSTPLIRDNLIVALSPIPNPATASTKRKMAKPPPSKPYSTGEKVLCDHQGMIYEAIILDIKSVNGEMQYLIHYQGWSNRWDEWVSDERLYEYNEENLKKQRELEDKNVRAEKARGGKMVAGGKRGRTGTFGVGGGAALTKTVMSITSGNQDMATELVPSASDGGSSSTTSGIGGAGANLMFKPNRTSTPLVRDNFSVALSPIPYPTTASKKSNAGISEKADDAYISLGLYIGKALGSCPQPKRRKYESKILRLLAEMTETEDGDDVE